MIKKLKISFLIAFFSFFVGYHVFAADLTFTNDATVTVNSNNYTIKSGSTATTMTVNGTQLIVTVPAGNSFTLVSPNKYTLANDANLTQSCDTNQNLVVVNGLATVTFTPTTVACTINTSGGGGSISGAVTPAPVVPVVPSAGSVGGSSSIPSLTITPPATNTVITTAIPGCNNGTSGFSIITGQSCAGNNSAIVSATSTSYDFGTVTLKNGSKGPAVVQLQMFLNAKLNLGLALDGKLGPKTIAVIKQWQKSNGLVADGLVGAKTKALMNSMAN